jgi:hypothetical protein
MLRRRRLQAENERYASVASAVGEGVRVVLAAVAESAQWSICATAAHAVVTAG